MSNVEKEKPRNFGEVTDALFKGNKIHTRLGLEKATQEVKADNNIEEIAKKDNTTIEAKPVQEDKATIETNLAPRMSK